MSPCVFLWLRLRRRRRWQAVWDDMRKPVKEFGPDDMLLNLAIGGMNGGDPSGTEFPARFEVDYVRVYQKGNSKSEALNPK